MATLILQQDNDALLAQKPHSLCRTLPPLPPSSKPLLPYKTAVVRCSFCGSDPKFWVSEYAALYGQIPTRRPHGSATMPSPRSKRKKCRMRPHEKRELAQAFQHLELGFGNRGGSRLWRAINEIHRLRLELNCNRARELELEKLVGAFQLRYQRNEATRVVQAAYRRYRHVLKNDAALKLQATYRGRKVRLEICRKVEAAASTKIQAATRGCSARMKIRQIKEERKKRVAEKNEQKAKNVSATKVQSLYRGRAKRLRVELEQNSASLIQAAMRGKSVRFNVKKCQAAAVRIQKVNRGYQGRQVAEERRVAVNRLAVKIQAAFRGRLVRRGGSEETKEIFTVDGCGQSLANGCYFQIEALADGVPQYERMCEESGIRFVIQRVEKGVGQKLWVFLEVNTTGDFKALYANDTSAKMHDLPPSHDWALAQDGNNPVPTIKWNVHKGNQGNEPTLISLAHAGTSNVNGLYKLSGTNDGAGQWEMVGKDRIFVLQRTPHDDSKMWVVAAVNLSDGTKFMSDATQVYYVNRSANETPPLSGWILGQDGEAPTPSFEVAVN